MPRLKLIREAVWAYLRYWGRVWRKAISFVWSTALGRNAKDEAVLVLAAILVILVIACWPKTDRDLLILFAPLIALAGVVALVGLLGLVLAPFQLDRELRAQVARFSERKLEVTSGYPIIYMETGVPPLGWYLLIPNLQITNRDAPVDLDLWLTVRTHGHDYATMLTLENSELVSARAALPRGLQGHAQLQTPLRIGEKSRAVGFAGFGLDILPRDFDYGDNWRWSGANHP